MIQQETILRSADNAGARYIKCIKVRGGLKRRCATINNLITVSIINLKHKRKLGRKEKYTALVINIKKKYLRKDGVYINWRKNRALLLTPQLKFLGTRIYGPVCYELRSKTTRRKYKRIISYSEGTL